MQHVSPQNAELPEFDALKSKFLLLDFLRWRLKHSIPRIRARKLSSPSGDLRTRRRTQHGSRDGVVNDDADYVDQRGDEGIRHQGGIHSQLLEPQR